MHTFLEPYKQGVVFSYRFLCLTYLHREFGNDYPRKLLVKLGTSKVLTHEFLVGVGARLAPACSCFS